MCFAPQRRALFPHQNFQKWSERGVFCTFCLRNVLRATTASTFSTSQLPKVFRGWYALYILTSKCASCRKGVHFFDISTAKSGPHLVCFVHFDFKMCFAPQRRAMFISHLASWLRTRRFSEPTFRPSRAPNHWKNTVLRDFPTFSRICIFFLLTLLSSLIFSLLIFLFSLPPLPCSAFHLSILSEVWLLNFLRSLLWWWWCCLCFNKNQYSPGGMRGRGGTTAGLSPCSSVQDSPRVEQRKFIRIQRPSPALFLSKTKAQSFVTFVKNLTPYLVPQFVTTPCVCLSLSRWPEGKACHGQNLVQSALRKRNGQGSTQTRPQLHCQPSQHSFHG